MRNSSGARAPGSTRPEEAQTGAAGTTAPPQGRRRRARGRPARGVTGEEQSMLIDSSPAGPDAYVPAPPTTEKAVAPDAGSPSGSFWSFGGQAPSGEPFRPVDGWAFRW